MAEELATEALETATYDEFAEQRIAAGRSIMDIFPPATDVLREYAGMEEVPLTTGAPRGVRAFIGGNGNRASGSSRDNMLAKEI